MMTENDYHYITALLREYNRTVCTCGSDMYLVCHYHKLIYCVICDSAMCPKCESEIINSEIEDE